MANRKLKATNLFTGREMLDGNAVLIIDEEGIIQEIVTLAEAGEGVENYQGMLIPGLVNCHCHLELSHMKGQIPEKTGLVDFLLSVMKKRNFSLETIQEAIAQAENEMLDNGIVAVGDICNTTDTILQKQSGNIYYHNFIETMGFVEANAQQRFDNSLKVFNEFAQLYSLPIESVSIVPHAPYSVSKKLFQLISTFPGNHLLSIHNQEIEAENEFIKSGTGDFCRLYKEMGIDISSFYPTGKKSLENFLPYFHKNQSLILVHNVATGKEDFESMAIGGWQMAGEKSDIGQTSSANLFFCLCPNANEYISGKLPAIDLLIKNECKIVIGTDSLASNHELNILGEMKTIQKNFPNIETEQLLKWATINGAEALQMDGIIGSFDSGKQPGVLLIENLENNQLKNETSIKRLI